MLNNMLIYRIYPFVAADAVTKDKQPSKIPNYDPNSIKRTDVGNTDFYKDYFSPPKETEGKINMHGSACSQVNKIAKFWAKPHDKKKKENKMCVNTLRRHGM